MFLGVYACAHVCIKYPPQITHSDNNKDLNQVVWFQSQYS